MAILLKVDGTVQTAFGIGGSILNNDGVQGLQVTTDGSTLATLQGAVPSAGDDYTTKTYVDGLVGSDASASLNAQDTHAFGDGTGAFQTTVVAPQATKTFRVIVEVTSAYDAGTTIDGGYANATSAFFSALDVTSADTTVFDIVVEQSDAADQTFTLTVANAGAITQGALNIYYSYVTTLAN